MGIATLGADPGVRRGGAVFDVPIVVNRPRHPLHADIRLLDYLSALTFDFEREGHTVSAVLIYAEPDPVVDSLYHSVIAQDTGFEGIACVDDTARAALLGLAVHEQSGSRKALALARRWLTFVEYMQYSDGRFGNFIRNMAGTRNATGLTSVKGGPWWTARALWSLSRAYRVTRNPNYLDRYAACPVDSIMDGKINAILALAELELYAVRPTPALRTSILDRCTTILGSASDPYFLDHAGQFRVHLWGYHQLHAVSLAALVLERPDLLKACRRTVQNLVEPDVRHCFWHSFPDRSKAGVCAYDVAPLVQGLASMYTATGADKYRQLALRACAWFYGRNDARTGMYDPSTGRCRDGITDGIASRNCGAESAIEAGFAELERRRLMTAP